MNSTYEFYIVCAGKWLVTSGVHLRGGWGHLATVPHGVGGNRHPWGGGGGQGDDYVIAFNGDETDVSSIMSEWGSVDLCYLIGSPPYWKELAIRLVLSASGQKEFLLTKMHWCVAEMRCATWKIQAPDVKPLIGNVFRTQSKERQMMLISKEDYKQRRQPTTRSHLLSTNTRKPPQPEDTTLAFEFKRKRDPPPS